MTREQFIERALRQIYGGQPSDDSDITNNLVNFWLDDAIAIAAKANYADNLKIDGIAYVNNSFHTTFKNIAITVDEFLLYKVTLPHLPFGIGTSEGITTVRIKDNKGHISLPVVLMNQSQQSFYRTMRPVGNRVLGYSEGQYIYIYTDIGIEQYTASVTMISGGDRTDLDATLNVPSDYYPVMVEYIKQQLMFERSVPKDVTNDGSDIIKTT